MVAAAFVVAHVRRGHVARHRLTIRSAISRCCYWLLRARRRAALLLLPLCCCAAMLLGLSLQPQPSSFYAAA